MSSVKCQVAPDGQYLEYCQSLVGKSCVLFRFKLSLGVYTVML